MKPPQIGQRVRLVRPYEFDPMGQVPVGATGTVVQIRDGCTYNIQIKLDRHCAVPHLENDTIAFYVECGPLSFNGNDVLDVVEQFHLTCDIIPLRNADIRAAHSWLPTAAIMQGSKVSIADDIGKILNVPVTYEQIEAALKETEDRAAKMLDEVKKWADHHEKT